VLTYPEAASREYITGRVKATFAVNRSGHPRQIRLVGVRAFADEVRGALKTAAFGSDCRGRKTTVWFSFSLDRKLPLGSQTKIERISATEYAIIGPTDLTGSIDVDPYMIDESDTRFTARLRRWFGSLRFW
jgi:hypothetical protein